MFRLPLAGILCALALSGCLPKSEFQATIQVLDEETGRPIPDAWVLPTAHIITEPPVDRFDVLAAERGRTGADGVARFTRVLGLYRPDAPQDPLWKAVDAKQAALRKPGSVAGGSIVVLAAGYGLVHQPFAVEDSPAFQSWLKDNPGRAQDYGGPLGRHAVKTNLKALLLKSADFKDGVRLTLRLRKPTSARELAETESFRLARVMSGTWHALSRQTGATEREQRAIYEFCAAQMKAVADETRDPWHREMYEAYFNAEARRKYISENHALGPDAQNGLIQAWLAQKALEILPQEAEEVKVYANEVLLGVLEEGRSPAWQNHFLDPKEPANGLPGSQSALRWAGLDGDNPDNPWDWQDAQRYYREGDRRKAYLALGHVARLLGNLAIPKYTVPDPVKETAFEMAVLKVMGDNLGQLPPEYWHSVKEPAFARTTRERFEAGARRMVEAGGGAWEARGPGQMGLSPAMTDLGGSDGGLGAAKAAFPQAITQAAGLLWDFHRLMHPPAYVQAPGNGNDGPQEVRLSSGTPARSDPAPYSGAHLSTSSSVGGSVWSIAGEIVRCVEGVANQHWNFSVPLNKEIIEGGYSKDFYYKISANCKRLGLQTKGVSMTSNAISQVYEHIDNRGVVLWKETEVEEFSLSADGTRILLVRYPPITQEELEDQEYIRPSRSWAVVYDDDKRELLRINPIKGRRHVFSPGMSRNGKFGQVSNICFSLESGEKYEAPLLGSTSIDEDGNCRVWGIRDNENSWKQKIPLHERRPKKVEILHERRLK